MRDWVPTIRLGMLHIKKQMYKSYSGNNCWKCSRGNFCDTHCSITLHKVPSDSWLLFCSSCCRCLRRPPPSPFPFIHTDLIIPATFSPNVLNVHPVISFQPSADPCPICTDPGPNAMTSCGHYFHFRCISEWLGRGNSTCPTCRSPNMEIFVRREPGISGVWGLQNWIIVSRVRSMEIFIKVYI